MPEYTATSQFIPAHTDLAGIQLIRKSQLIFKNPSQEARKLADRTGLGCVVHIGGEGDVGKKEVMVGTGKDLSGRGVRRFICKEINFRF